MRREAEDIPEGYQFAHIFFVKQLLKKHTGYSFLKKSNAELFNRIKERLDSLRTAIPKVDYDTIKQEAADLMIYGLMLIVWADYWNFRTKNPKPIPDEPFMSLFDFIDLDRKTK